MSYVPARIKAHWSKVGAMDCAVCGAYGIQLAHQHGPSLRARDPRFLKPKGKKPLWSHWLVLPLCPPHHWLCDNRPRDFEACYGSPYVLLVALSVVLGYDVFELALAEMKPMPNRARQDSDIPTTVA